MSYKVKGIILEREDGEKIVVQPNYSINEIEKKSKKLRVFAKDLNAQDVVTLGIIEDGTAKFGAVCVPKDWGTKK